MSEESILADISENESQGALYTAECISSERAYRTQSGPHCKLWRDPLHKYIECKTEIPQHQPPVERLKGSCKNRACSGQECRN